ncbi:hypothetical protein CJF42_19735 [Pseudoalteromonas sp. NBT06-2]|uniref:ATP-binding protein n=1 Tax=Pseudoalteromonas sp. NBT06-2 TaxID=2025950 RepID=UPI000BA71DFC|nr:ATP-binding protein [Pseudoalteromonas sp. NBT06-2]PAJ72733.1 hypothetical protein CJF42_19735 [Pseudoalteromonas sp. NBT06-2]
MSFITNALIPQRQKSPFLTFIWIILSLVIATASCVYTWQYSKNEALALLSQTAKQHLNLYGSKIKEEFGQIHSSVLPILAQNQVIQKYLITSEPEGEKLARDYLNTSLMSLPKRAIFIGNAQKLLLASKNYSTDFTMMKRVFKLLATRAFKGKNSQMFLFSQALEAPKFLIAIPVSNNDKNLGFMGLLLDLSDFQTDLAKSWTTSEETLAISDQRGIILMSSDPNWLYRTFSNLPYQVKKNLRTVTGQQTAFEQLGIVSINEGILTMHNIDVSTMDEHYLVNSLTLNDYQLRIHHLSNITPVIKSSYINAALTMACFILGSLILLLFKVKKNAIRLELAHQNQIKESEKHKHQIIEATASGLITFHYGGKIESLNLAALNLFSGHSTAQFDALSELFVQAHIVQKASYPNKNVYGHSMETIALKSDGSQFPVQIFIKAMGFGEPPLYLLTIIDISDKKNTEAELKQNQKMAAMGMMATTLAHEISQPITAIKTEASIGKKLLSQGRPEETSESLATIIGYTQLLSKITSQLKDFAKKKKSDSRIMSNIYEVIQYSHILYQHRLENEHIIWNEMIEDRGLCAAIDPYQLQQVMGNLIQNSCDALTTFSEKKLSVCISTEDEYLYIDISDTGKGIDLDLQQSIFDPFVSTKNKSSSMGLGLAICKDILLRTQGNIELLQSEKGAHFRVTLLRHNPK